MRSPATVATSSTRAMGRCLYIEWVERVGRDQRLKVKTLMVRMGLSEAEWMHEQQLLAKSLYSYFDQHYRPGGAR